MKKNILWTIMNSIFLVIFNTFFFIIPDGISHPASVWISYVFIHLAYFMLLLTPYLIRKGKSRAVFGFSLYSVSSAYFLIELFIGVIFIVISPENFRPALLVQLSLAGIYGIMLVSNLIANEHTADAEEKRQVELDYVKQAASKLKSMLANAQDKSVAKKIEKVYDAVNSSPVKSHPDMPQIESQILTQIKVLEDMVLMGNTDGIPALADSLLIAVNERNRQLKMRN